MFWNDILDVRDIVAKLVDRVSHLERAVIELSQNPKTEIFDQKAEGLKETVQTFLFSEDEYSPINRIHDKLDELISAHVASKTMDKFDEYMTNVDKLNEMVNEFKGCVSMARGAIAERKQANETSHEPFIKEETLSKIDYIYHYMGKLAVFMQNCEKKSRKRAKKRRKAKETP